ncbi:MAG: HEPN domain-containing protein [Elusimicrobiota bacterium]
MNNYIKTKGWLQEALWEIDGFINARDNNDWAHAVYYLQQSVEKSCKAIISFLGIEVKHTHFPAEEIIEQGIIENSDEIKRLNLKENDLSLLREIVNYAKSFETEKTKPRYGKELKNRIVLPTEIYTAEKSARLFEYGFKFWNIILEFFKKFNIKELKKVLADIDAKIKKSK